MDQLDYERDDLDPIRGVVNGLLFSAVIWTIVGLIAWVVVS